jgi:hypothetical protein
MIRRHLIKDNEKRKRVAHFAAAATIFMHSYENYETRHHSYLLFLAAGFIILALAIFHPKLEEKYPWIDGASFVVEGILSFVISIDLFNYGKKALPLCYLLLSLFQFFMAFRKGKKGIQKHKEKHQMLHP